MLCEVNMCNTSYIRLTTCLENLEMSWNLTAVKEIDRVFY